MHFEISGKALILVNLHIYWNPTYDIVKYAQAAMIIREVEVLKDQLGSPCIFAGDFNSTPESPVF